MEQSPGRINATRPMGRVSVLAQWEAGRLWHAYLGPEHLLLGLLVQGDNLAARALRAHGLDLETVRAEVDHLIARGRLPAPPPSDVQELLNAADLKTVRVEGDRDRGEVERLVAQGALPRPPISDAGLLASIGIDLEAVAGRLIATFGQEAYWQATQRVLLRPTQAALHRAPRDPPLHICARVFGIAAQEAVARGQEIGPEHLLLGLLADAADPLETEHPQEQRLRGLLGLPTRGAHGIKLLVEARGLTLGVLRAAVLAELDRDGAGVRDRRDG
jgi:Clp amino terminal domain, pathogenicity island component